MSRDDLIMGGYNNNRQRAYMASGLNIKGRAWTECFVCSGIEFRIVRKLQFGRVLLACCCCGRTLSKDPRDITVSENGKVKLNPSRTYVKI